MTTTKKLPAWPLYLIALPAAVSIWSGWVTLGGLCGFGVVHPLPGIAPGAELNTAITLPVGIEAYAAYAMAAWLRPGAPTTARAFAKRSAIGSLGLGMLGQVAYHLLAAAHATRAPWPLVVLVGSLPVAVVGLGAALAHLLRASDSPSGTPSETVTAAIKEPVTVAAPEPVTASASARSPQQSRRRNGKSRRGGSLDQRKAARAALEAEMVALLDAEPAIGTTALARRLECSVSTAQRLRKEIRVAEPVI
jgi:hypothetical protein